MPWHLPCYTLIHKNSINAIADSVATTGRKKFMKLLAALLMMIGISQLAQARPETISQARYDELVQTVLQSSAVAPYVALAEKNLNASAGDAEKNFVDLQVDCDARPMSYGIDLAVGYCLITVQTKYGWHADPYLA
jgi:hypothetical protein